MFKLRSSVASSWEATLIFTTLLFSSSIILESVQCWKQDIRRSLSCWQCASVPGHPTECPRDSRPYNLPEWNACMVWRLKSNNRVILQNFVYSHNDCTKSKLEYWSTYIQKVWNEPGTAKCCFSDLCNDGASEEDDVPFHSSFLVDDLSGDSALAVQNGTKRLSDKKDQFDCDKCLRIGNTQCGNSSSSEILELNAQRLDFDNMVAKMSEMSEQICTCEHGYAPIYDDRGALERCKDPIIATSTIGGRCLKQDHCASLNNSVCLVDTDVRLPSGNPFKTCQCRRGYWASKYSCDEEKVALASLNKSEYKPTSTTTASSSSEVATCSRRDENCTSIENAYCDLRKGRCECIEGFLPVYDEDHPKKLTWCKDPIVLTSTVGGYCLVQRHCKSLMGTECTDVGMARDGGRFKKCECRRGLKAQRPDPVLGVVRRCIGPQEEGVLSLISQALFGPEKPGDGAWPIKVNLRLTEKAILDSCSGTTTVVEMNEWIPSEQFSMKVDNVTNALMGIVYAKLPTSALGHHGVLIRLLSSIEEERGMLMYSIAMQRNRVMQIRKSFQDVRDNRRENVQAEELSNSYKWLNSESYTGIWFLVKYGYIAFGIVDEHTIQNPLMAWRDNLTPYDVSVAGLTTEGSAIFYAYDCPVMNPLTFYPRGACTTDFDCISLHNTVCKREKVPTIAPNTTLTLLACQCSDGYLPIPDPFRMIENGCYDPIMRTPTVNARCLADRHCKFLSHTECLPSYQDPDEMTCRCKKGALPKERLPETGFIPGCRETEFAKLLTVDSCKKRFTLGAITGWIPVTIMRMPYRPSQNMYSVAFYAKFHGAANPVNTTIAIKLMDMDKSPRKLYKVTISTTGNVAIYENIQGQTFLFGTYNRQSLQIIDNVIPPEEFSPMVHKGFWVRYKTGGAEKGTVSVGKIGVESPLLKWQDTSETAIEETENVGFEVEEGGNVEFGSVCFDV